MPVYRTTTGRVIEVPDGTSPEVLRKLGVARQEARGPATNQTRAAAPQRSDPERDEIKRRADLREKRGAGGSFGERAANAMMFGFRDELEGGIGALTTGVVNAVRRGDIGEIAKEYRISKGEAQEVARRYQANNPIKAGVADVAGSLIAPSGVISSTATAARIPGAARAAAALGRRGAMVQGAAAGAGAGALSAVGNADGDVGDMANAAVNGAVGGGLMGGAMGGAVSLVGKGINAVRAARPSNAADTAAERVAGLLKNAEINPSVADARLRFRNQEGADASLMDLSPGLAGEAQTISRNVNVPSANNLIERSRGRQGQRPTRFSEQVSKAADDLPTQDALTKLDDNVAARKAAGRVDYAKGGAMDDPVTWSPELEKTMRSLDDKPAAQRALKDAYDEALDWGDMPAELASAGTFTHIPTMRAWDYAHRALNRAAKNARDPSEAAKLNSIHAELKEAIGNANPAWKQTLATQRTYFQEQAATEAGNKFWSRIVSEPRQLLKEFDQLSDANKLDWRIGAIDRLINRENSALARDPVSAFEAATSTPAQRELMKKVFGSEQKFNEFADWIRFERKAMDTDAQIAPGRQFDPSANAISNDDDGGAGALIANTAKGALFSGSGGALSNLAMSIRNIGNSTPRNTAVQDEIARILMSKGGDGLVEKLTGATARVSKRKADALRAAVQAGKTAGAHAGTVMYGGD